MSPHTLKKIYVTQVLVGLDIGNVRSKLPFSRFLPNATDAHYWKLKCIGIWFIGNFKEHDWKTFSLKALENDFETDFYRDSSLKLTYMGLKVTYMGLKLSYMALWT